VTEEETREEPSIVTTVRLRRDQHDRLRELAASEDRSMGWMIRQLVDERIAAHEKL
jgi:predicted transcriptional regulator